MPALLGLEVEDGHDGAVVWDALGLGCCALSSSLRVRSLEPKGS